MNKLAAFLYLIMRDHVPTGVIANIIQEVDELAEDDTIVCSNDHLKAMAEDYAERILD